MTIGKRIILLATAAALLLAGAATAAVLTKTITLKSGKCVTIAKTKICAAKVSPVTIKVPGPPSTTVTVTATVTAPPPPPAIAFSDGTYRVNVDIQPGTYKAVAPASDCYWERLSGFSGGLEDIIANSFAGPSIVTIAPSDVGFDSRNCGGWSKIG